MAKKYSPSGYQIINLDMTDKTSGTPFTPETEDEKLLLKLLLEESEKPILLKIKTSGYDMIGFCVSGGDTINLTMGAVGSSVTEEIISSIDKLIWTETEE